MIRIVIHCLMFPFVLLRLVWRWLAWLPFPAAIFRHFVGPNHFLLDLFLFGLCFSGSVDLFSGQSHTVMTGMGSDGKSARVFIDGKTHCGFSGQTGSQWRK